MREIPKLHVVVRRTLGSGGSARYLWNVTLKAAVGTPEGPFGYRASGIIDDAGLRFEVGPEIYDESGSEWAPLTSAQRPDIWKRIAQIANYAVERLKLGGDDTFEHMVP